MLELWVKYSLNFKTGARKGHYDQLTSVWTKSMKKSEKGRTLTCLRKQRQRYNGAQDFVALAGQRFFPLRSSLALCAFKSSKFIVWGTWRTFHQLILRALLTLFIFIRSWWWSSAPFLKARVVVVQIKPVSKFRSTLPRNAGCKADCSQFMINSPFQNANYSDRW